MRKIEFRGKSVKNDRWYYGDLQTNSVNDTWISDLDCWEGDRGFFENVKYSTVGQFTGAYDSKKNKIFEGDIYHMGDKNILYVVKWLDCGLKGRQISNKSCAGLDYWSDKIVIVGNIHDNPQMMQRAF